MGASPTQAPFCCIDVTRDIRSGVSGKLPEEKNQRDGGKNHKGTANHFPLPSLSFGRKVLYSCGQWDGTEKIRWFAVTVGFFPTAAIDVSSNSKRRDVKY